YGLYNILINEEVQDILALGAGAISKRVDAAGNTKRKANFKEVDDYIAHVDEMIRRKAELYYKMK
ncbi:MAG: coproporphyrinogen dehydrogenase HemZ, partial [Lachnospiraceae bacterium]|nr:coproporphyrinogen dehydrogenase HemZ [Lachnospiraceae bacterium]